jgi:hypothetical protein
MNNDTYHETDLSNYRLIADFSGFSEIFLSLSLFQAFVIGSFLKLTYWKVHSTYMEARYFVRASQGK